MFCFCVLLNDPLLPPTSFVVCVMPFCMRQVELNSPIVEHYMSSFIDFCRVSYPLILIYRHQMVFNMSRLNGVCPSG